MAQQVTAYRASNGSLHDTAKSAERVDAALEVERLADELAKAIRPAYSDEDEIARGLLDQADLVCQLAAAMTRAR